MPPRHFCPPHASSGMCRQRTPYVLDKDMKKKDMSQRLSKKMFQNNVFFFFSFTMSQKKSIFAIGFTHLMLHTMFQYACKSAKGMRKPQPTRRNFKTK